MEAGPSTDPGSAGTVKRTRRRLRLSCVECTKRRQKCDRKYPCSLCESRNVAHLCRWADGPVSRPPPARPPAHATSQAVGSAPVGEAQIQALCKRISVIERAFELYTRGRTHAEVYPTLAAFTSANSSAFSPHLSPPCTDQSSPSQNSSFSSPEPGSFEESKQISKTVSALLSPGTSESVIPLVQLSVGHQMEYLGRGSAIGTLRSMCKLPWKCVRNDSAANLFVADGDYGVHGQFTGKIPPPIITTLLLNAYFAHSNWYFGLPESWLANKFSEMWEGMHDPFSSPVHLSPYWISLLFAVGAVVPRDIPDLLGSGVDGSGIDSAEHHFTYSMAALQAADDMYEHSVAQSASGLGVSCVVEGTLFGCLSVPILAKCLAERNRLSDAWKLLGRWIRIAESVGLHRDSGECGSQVTEDEVLVRRLAWCNLVIWDRFYSLMLGRSHMSILALSDVTPRMSEGLSSPREIQVYLSLLFRLSTLVAEVNEKSLGNIFPNASMTRKLDAKLEQWYYELTLNLDATHQYDGGLHVRHPDPPNKQAHVLHSWYLYTRMKVHINYLLAQQSFPIPTEFVSGCESLRWSQNCCATFCTQLISLHCNMLESTSAYDGSAYLAASAKWWSSESLFSLFDATIALAKVSGSSPHILRVLRRAYDVFNRLSRSGNAGKLPRAAVGTLDALLRSLGIDLNSRITVPPKLEVDIGGFDQHRSQAMLGNSADWSSMGRGGSDWYSNTTPTNHQFP